MQPRRHRVTPPSLVAQQIIVTSHIRLHYKAKTVISGEGRGPWQFQVVGHQQALLLLLLLAFLLTTPACPQILILVYRILLVLVSPATIVTVFAPVVLMTIDASTSNELLIHILIQLLLLILVGC